MPDNPRYVVFKKGRYFWSPSPRLRAMGLKTVALGADRAQALSAATRLNKQLADQQPGSAIPGSVRWLFDQFEASDKFKKLARETQQDYRWLAKRLCGHPIASRPFGDYGARGVRPRHADLIYSQLAEASGGSTAHYICRYARRVWKWGYRKEFTGENPWSGMELAGIPERHQRWTSDQVRAFCAVARDAKADSLALAVLLAYEFGHRQKDVLGLTWTALDGGRRDTSKTGVNVPLSVSVYPELEAALVATARTSTHVVVCETTQQPYKADFFRHRFRAIARKAGLPADLQFRDLRATAATELSDAGADVIELSTHTGHKTVQMARRYARRTTAQFESAARKRVAARTPPERAS